MTPGKTTWYLWDGDQLLAEYDATGTRDVRYAYAGGFAPTQVAYPGGQCNDGVDNDGDGLTDFAGNDLECASAADPLEGPAPAAGQCSDSSDNDGDTLVDGADPDCTSPADESEAPLERIYAVHSDHLDTPRMLTDANGTPVWRAAYQAFGAVPAAALLEDPDGDGNTLTFNIRFPGQYYDAETETAGPGTGLHYNRFRYYDPSIGRYISADPIGQFGGPNLYSYVLNDPVNWMDPFGLDRLINPRPGGPGGPVITFNNDNPNGASPNQPVTDATAAMVESAVVNSGVSSVNINSTTGGHASNPDSRHNQSKAVDINSVNGKPVPNAGKGSDPCDPAADPVGDLQKAFAGEPNIRENFGPSRNEKTNTPGGPVTPRPDQAGGHGNHIHASGQR